MPEQVLERKGREGGRWVNERPSPTEFGEWFHENMKIDPKLDTKDYVSGVVLIPGVDRKAPTVVGFRNGAPIIEEREELFYTPYAKVEARIDYFWDLLGVHPEWLGIVERVTPPRLPIDFVHTEESEQAGLTESGRPINRTINRKIRTPSAMTALAYTLGDGFSVASIPVGGGYSHFLICTTRVAIYDREEYKADPKNAVPLRAGQGSKQVPLLIGRNNPFADPSSMMKAETGSLGRALGFAGIFVIPGSGVATAEDMLEALSQGATPAQEPAAPPSGGQGPAAPAETPVRTGAEQQVDEETELRKRAVALYNRLQEDFPAKHDEFTEWARGRRLRGLADARGPMLRGVVKTLERLTDEAEQSAQRGVPDTSGPEDAPTSETGERVASGEGEQRTEEPSDVPAQTPEESGNGEENASPEAG